MKRATTGRKGVKGVTYITLRQLAPQNSEEMVVVRGQEGMYNSILTIIDHNCAKAVILLPCKETIDVSLALSSDHLLPHVSLQPGKISGVDITDEEVAPLATGQIDGEGSRVV
jgi:hypothetical protein